jgi:hypothetical protein
MNSKKNTASVFAHPDLDACVAIEVRADGVILLDFLAKGRSQRREGGKVVGYNKRNPDRLALVEHCLEALDDAGFVAVASSCRGDVTQLDEDLLVDARQSYSRAGNFRWSLFVRPSFGFRAASRRRGDVLAVEALGLAERKHRPVKTSWPTLVASLVVALSSVLAA